jgi:hypothetical protein
MFPVSHHRAGAGRTEPQLTGENPKVHGQKKLRRVICAGVVIDLRISDVVEFTPIRPRSGHSPNAVDPLSVNDIDARGLRVNRSDILSARKTRCCSRRARVSDSRGRSGAHRSIAFRANDLTGRRNGLIRTPNGACHLRKRKQMPALFSVDRATTRGPLVRSGVVPSGFTFRVWTL